MQLADYEQQADDTRRTAVLYQGLADTAAQWARFLAHGAITYGNKGEAIRAQHDAARLARAARLRADEHRHAAGVAASVALHPSSQERHDYKLRRWGGVGAHSSVRFIAVCDCGHETGLMPTAGLAGSAHDAHVATVQLGGAA